MKKVEAYIKPHKLTDVAMALRRIRGLSGGTVFEVRGWGRGKQKDDADGLEQEASDFEAHAAVAVFRPDALAPEVVAAIASAARTGLRGDGKIYVLPVEATVRISPASAARRPCDRASLTQVVAQPTDGEAGPGAGSPISEVSELAIWGPRCIQPPALLHGPATRTCSNS